jgi:hypothetical protein
MQGGGRKTVRWRETKIGGMEANGMRYRPLKPALMAPRPSQKFLRSLALHILDLLVVEKPYIRTAP